MYHKTGTTLFIYRWAQRVWILADLGATHNDFENTQRQFYSVSSTAEVDFFSPRSALETEHWICTARAQYCGL